MSGGKGGDQTVGYKYYMGLHAGLCHGPVDELVEIRGGDLTIWSGAVTVSGQLFINAPDAYGGDTKEGGVQGKLDLMMGEATQVPNSYLTNILGGIESAFRGLVTCVFESGLIGSNNPYPKPWSFRLRRSTKGWFADAPWYSAKAKITLSNGVAGMNPAHIVYETLTNPDWGMGFPAGIIDDTSFRAAADQLYSEGFGLCLLWLRQDTIEAWLQLVMDYIGGCLVQSKTTGKFQLILIRGGYDVDTLPVFTRDNVLDMQSLEAPGITGTTNEIVVQWLDPVSKSKQLVQLQALGAIQAAGVVVSATHDFPGIASQDLAARVAQRELRGLSVPLKRVQLKLDRTASDLLPGKVFVLNFPEFSIDSMVFRVGEVDYGTLTDGSITVTALQDVFSLPDTTYIEPPATGWTPPSTVATAPPYTKGIEINYRDLVKTLSSAELAAVPVASGYAGMLCARPSGLAIEYRINTQPGSGAYTEYGRENFCPTAEIQVNVAPYDTTITLNLAIDPGDILIGIIELITIGSAAMIDDEIVRFMALNPVTGLCTIARGCVDTVPAPHAAGARIWFFDTFIGSDKQEYFTGEVVNQKPRTVTTADTLPLAAAPIISVTIAERQGMPFQPAYLTINGTRWDLVTSASGNVTLAWRGRNRLTQADQLIEDIAATVTPEAGTTYNVRVYDNSSSTLLTSQLGLTTMSCLFALDTSVAARVEVEAVRDGIASYQKQIALFNYTAVSDGIVTEGNDPLMTEASDQIYTG